MIQVLLRNEGVLQTNPCGKPIGKFVCKMQELTTSRIPFGYRKISCGPGMRGDQASGRLSPGKQFGGENLVRLDLCLKCVATCWNYSHQKSAG